MKNISIFVFLLCFTTYCKNSTEKHYKNSDETSGGFIDVQLDLNADRTINLLRVDQNVVSENEAGTSYEPETLSVAGTWDLDGDKIYCDIKESEEFVSNAFFKSDFKTKDLMQNYNQIVFPVTTDTIYIYGQPCILTKTTNR